MTELELVHVPDISHKVVARLPLNDQVLAMFWGQLPITLGIDRGLHIPLTLMRVLVQGS